MNKVFAYPLVAFLVAFAAPATYSVAYAQSSDTQTEEQQPKPETETGKPSDN
jgi:hypothetical protein